MSKRMISNVTPAIAAKKVHRSKNNDSKRITSTKSLSSLTETNLKRHLHLHLHLTKSNEAHAECKTAKLEESSGKRFKAEPILSPENQSSRLNFAKKHCEWGDAQWKSVVLQDERAFHLDGLDGFSNYYSDLGAHEGLLSQRPWGTSVYVYLIISSAGPIHIELSHAKLKPEECVQIILRERQKITAKLNGLNFILQDCNWSATATPSTRDWLSNQGILTQKWPTIAHDFNIMEKIWGHMAREIFDGGRKFSRKDDLIHRVKEAWERLPQDMIVNLYSSLPERLSELYRIRGLYVNC